ncbi:ubiquitin carboxyl-terminal hydrolase 32 isoform X2 [Culicoides brevitarsis]|uniref:ubiquitin carboxyl-terminal hydrolase 32 isoform X2 n=1 Tax=Culicoides brevitarsis TaxID=469753 RepID=UPI00307C99AC
MGEKNSKPSCITYEDSLKRISPAELERLKEAFKRSSGSGSQTLSKSAFIQDVLCESVPSSVADWLFAACGGTAKGIAFKELVCGLVLLTKGTLDEKIKFLWTLYCNESGTHIIKSDFQRQLQTEATYQSNNILTTTTTTTNGYSTSNSQQAILYNKYQVSLFGQSDRVTFEQFKSWITIHKDATILSKWLLVETCVQLTSDQDTPTFYQSLAGVTHLEEEDIEDLEKMFWNLKGSAMTGQLDMESLGPLISPPVPKSALTGVFLAFDENRDGHIDFKELCCGVSAACRGPTVERMKFCFKVFDTDRDGVLSFTEVEQMIETLMSVAKEIGNGAFKHLNRDQVLRELHMRRVTKVNSSEGGEEITEIPEFKLTQEDFLMWSVESALNLVQPFLDLLFEVCHIVLGLKPQCKHLEHEIVRGWLTREIKRGLKVGQFWYLISGDWWQNWLQWTQQNGTSSCMHCKSLPKNVDEAMICDESFTSNSTESMGDLLNTADSSSLGSGSSGISIGKQINGPPGQIDNNNLVSPSIYKTAKTLTGEGGRLKKDMPLVEHRDFELLPESLWKYLYLKYGGNLPLPRQVIQPPDSNQLELELYPLNLRILRHHQPNQQQQNNATSAAPFYSAISGGYGALASTNYSSFSSVSSALQPPKKYLAYTAAFSKLSTVKQVGEFLCQNLKLKQEDIRLWHVSNGLTTDAVFNLLEEEHLSLIDLDIKDNDEILLEVRNKDLTWPEELGSLTQSSFLNNQERRNTVGSIVSTSTHAPGATGLHNLGNTCFMNAALQVLFNTQPLTQYFRQNMHMFEVNTTNKLGTKGQLVMRYAELLKEVWTASSRSVAPLKLRFCVTKNAQQFSGGGQHDSQELLAWLLDALHEDLNRVTEKPYTELKDSDGRADALVAAEAWNQHHARNQSIIVDLFYGQLKSKVSCLTCGNESVRFDPFSLLSLPLPVENYVYCEVLVIFLNGSVPIKYGLRLNSESRYWDLKKHLSTLCNLEPEKMLVCELANAQIKCVLPNDLKIKISTAFELTCYEVPTLEEIARAREDTADIATNIEQGLKDIQRNQEQNQMSLSSVASSMVSISSSEEHGSGNGSSNKKNRSGSAASDIERCECYSKKRRPAKKNEQNINDTATFKFTKIEDSDSPPKTVSTLNLLNNSNNDAVSLASVNIDQSSNSREDRCVTCGRVILSDDDADCERKISETDSEPASMQDNSKLKTTSYLMAVHRNLCRQDTYFLSHHKTRPGLFGVPLLIPCYEGVTNKELYCSVWTQVSRLLSKLPPTPPDQANHATDCDDSLGYDFPFTLKAVAEGGRVCCLCPWSKFCRGCEIPCNDEPLLEGFLLKNVTPEITGSREPTPNLGNRTSSRASQRSAGKNNLSSLINLNNINLAIDWDPTALHLRYQSNRERIWEEHSSIAICRKQQTDPIDLDYCLRAFTSEEQLEQWYHCSHCKGKQPATKKLQIWKLPPILIVHLKRFNYVHNKWVKSQKVVNFPFQNFDPTPYLASVPQETILRHRELLEQEALESKNLCNVDCTEEINEFDRESEIASHIDALTENDNASASNAIDTNDSSELLKDVVEPQMAEVLKESKTKRNSVLASSRKSITKPLGRRKRLVSTSLTKTPVFDDELKDYHNHNLKEDEDPFDLKYNLYAVVSHSGLLNGGHYVAYAANPNSSWYCYNDSSCREINSQQPPNIDPSTAYLLFYERKGLDYVPYLPKIDGNQIPNVLEQEDADSDLRKMCVIA